MTFEARAHEVGQARALEAVLDRHAEGAQVLARDGASSRLPAAGAHTPGRQHPCEPDAREG